MIEPCPRRFDTLSGLACRVSMSASNESGEAIRRLEQHAWRSDVRELESVVVEAMIFARGKWITPEHLGLQVRSGSDAADVP